MESEKPLPYLPVWNCADDYVEALLQFVTKSNIFQTLCGGVHILDFLTREPDLYATVVPQDWRDWLFDLSISDFLDFLLRDDIDVLFDHVQEVNGEGCKTKPLPPLSLLTYVQTIRNLSLNRTYVPSETVVPDNLGRKLAMGMNAKKAHEVENFAAFIDKLVDTVETNTRTPVDNVIDFGSGQNYLGRVLASPLYQRPVIAVERKHSNISGAKHLDISAHLAKKIVIWRNRKAWRLTGVDNSDELRRQREDGANRGTYERHRDSQNTVSEQSMVQPGKIRYIEHGITNGDLSTVLEKLHIQEHSIPDERQDTAHDGSQKQHQESFIVVSLHSCGNLLHHGLRSLSMNPEVKAVAMVGCCYNLMTERLGPPTKKLPTLRLANKRLEKTGAAYDPHGFPMSNKLCTYAHADGKGKGISMNITARMMAVQAPLNWTKDECESFFTRHFFRALLQRIMLDKGYVVAPVALNDAVGASPSPAGSSSPGEPVIIGSLRKACYSSFVAYVRGALEKLLRDPEQAPRLQECLGGLTDEEIQEYENSFAHRKHHLSIIWTLMAFSACVVESLIVTDRWLYLKEQPEIKKCWVQSVFDYQQSPRNLAVIGIKK